MLFKSQLEGCLHSRRSVHFHPILWPGSCCWFFTVCSSLSFLHSPFTLFSWGRQFATSLRMSSPRMPMTLTDKDFPKFRVREVATLATIVASFPGLPCFCVHNNTREWKWGRPRSIHHMKDVRWTRGGHRGRARYSNIYLLDLKASFLLVKASKFNHTEVWSPKQW